MGRLGFAQLHDSARPILHSRSARTFDRLAADADLIAAFKHPLYDGRGRKLHFSDVFASQPPSIDKLSRSSSSSSSASQTINDIPQLAQRRVLVIFIRHFFCGNCQEYLSRLATHPFLSADRLAAQNLSLVIIGCGTSSHIDSYRTLLDLPRSWQLYSDPTSGLYRLLGMQRSLSLGARAPRYIQRSLTGNMLRSVAQGMRRIPEGDVLGAGGWDVNGGEFLFEMSPKEVGGLRKMEKDAWSLTWCHRMRNSRDHTELDELLPAIGLVHDVTTLTALAATVPTSPAKLHVRTQSSPMILREDSALNEKIEFNAAPPIKRRTTLRRSLSIRRQSWMGQSKTTPSSLSRVMSLRVQPK